MSIDRVSEGGRISGPFRMEVPPRFQSGLAEGDSFGQRRIESPREEQRGFVSHRPHRRDEGSAPADPHPTSGPAAETGQRPSLLAGPASVEKDDRPALADPGRQCPIQVDRTEHAAVRKRYPRFFWLRGRMSAMTDEVQQIEIDSFERSEDLMGRDVRRSHLHETLAGLGDLQQYA